jgi:hypothetical protein
MLLMNRSAANSYVTSPRRFILLPEEAAEGAPQGPRIRRYSLASFARTAGSQGAGRAEVGLAGNTSARDAGRSCLM